MSKPQWYYKLRNLPTHLTVQFLILVATILPRRMAVTFGGNFGVFVWHLFSGWRRTSTRNIELFHRGNISRADALRIGRQAAWNVGCHVMEFILMGRRPVDECLAMVVETHGLEQLESALAEGKGAICIGLHYGNWEICAGWITKNVRQMHAVGKKQQDPFISELAFRWRARFGVQNIFSGRQASAAILKALRGGDLLGLVADINGGSTGVFVPFCGIMASTVPGPGVLGARTGVPILLLFSRRLAPGQLALHVRLVNMEGLPDSQAEKEYEILCRVNDAYESVILEDPTQWLWGHKRWKTRPEGEPGLY